MKVFLIFIALSFVLLVLPALAGGKHDHPHEHELPEHDHDFPTPLDGEDGINGLPGRDFTSAAAMIQHHFNPDSDKWQASFSIGTFDSQNAYSASMGKQVCGTCPGTFVHGTATRVGDQTGGSIGVTLSW